MFNGISLAVSLSSFSQVVSLAQSLSSPEDKADDGLMATRPVLMFVGASSSSVDASTYDGTSAAVVVGAGGIELAMMSAAVTVGDSFMMMTIGLFWSSRGCCGWICAVAGVLVLLSDTSPRVKMFEETMPVGG